MAVSRTWFLPRPGSPGHGVGRPAVSRVVGWSGRLSLVGQFRWASLVVLAAAMLGAGAWVSQQAETSALQHTATLTALYVDSVLSDPLASLATQPRLDQSQMAALDHLLRETPLAEHVVDMQVWSPDGEVLYSPTERLIGQQYPVSTKLARALQGWVVADLSTLDDPDNAYLHSRSQTLLEVYAPVRQEDSAGRVLAVVEFYQQPDELLQQVATDRLHTWVIVVIVTAMVYLLLAGVVQRGSAVIARQQAALRSQFRELEGLHDRLRRAAGRTTTLNEQALRRIGADLHAGPGQVLALMLLRLDAVHQACNCGCLAVSELETLRGALGEAMGDLRAISAGLLLPELDGLGPADVVRRAVHAHERQTGRPVALAVGELPAAAPAATKVVLFRVLEEALSNAARHGQGAEVGVRTWSAEGGLAACVSDQGPGFAVGPAIERGHLGLANSRERVELLGGRFDVDSAPGGGTRVTIWLPLAGSGTQR